MGIKDNIKLIKATDSLLKEKPVKYFRKEVENGEVIEETPLTQEDFETQVARRRDMGFTEVSTWVIKTEETNTEIYKTLVVALDGGKNDK